MAKKQSMTLEEALQVILSSDGDNPYRAMLEFMAQNAMELEMTEHLGAKPYERSDERTGYRNGHKPRILTTAIGDIYLLVPQDRTERSPRRSSLCRITRSITPNVKCIYLTNRDVGAPTTSASM